MITFGFTGLLFAGVHHETRALSHLLLGATLSVAASLPSERLAESGRLMLVGAGGGLLLVAQAAGLATSVDPEATVGAITHLLLGVGAALAVGAWAGSIRSRDALVWPLLIGSAALVVLASLHVGLGLTSLFGVLSPHDPGVRFYAPFVNQNHFAGALLLGFPSALATALAPRQRAGVRWMAAALAATFAGSVLFTGAGAPLAALAVEGLLVGTLVWRPFALVGVLAAPAAGWMALSWASAHGSDAVKSGMGRVEIWRSSLDLLLDRPLLGSGSGTFQEAIQPYRRDSRWVQWGHAHNDWLEWLVETGLVGAMCGVVAAALVVRWRPARTSTVRPITVGLVGLLLHAFVDFPLQLPFVLMAVAGVVAWRTVAGQQPMRAPVTAIRALLVAGALLQVPGSAWQLRAARVEDAVARLSANPEDDAAKRVVRRWAPWQPDDRIAEVRATLARGDTDAARLQAQELAEHHPTDAKALAYASLALLRAGDTAAAVDLADRLTELAPWHREYWRLRAIAHTRLDRASGTGAWVDAIEADAPGAIEEAWRVLPVGLFWVDALEDASPGQQAAMAAHVLRAGDLDAALLGFRSAAAANPGQVSWGYVRALKQTHEHQELLDHLRGVRGDQATTRAVMQETAGCLDSLERWDESVEAWLSLFRTHGVGLGRAASAQSRAANLGSARALWERETLLGRRPSDQDYLDYARAHLHAGAPRDCLTILAAAAADAPPVTELADACRRAAR